MSGQFFYNLLEERTLLDRLLHSESGAEAWVEFLRRYSNLFFKVIWQHERDHDDAVEKYLFVCTKFAENDFAKAAQISNGLQHAIAKTLHVARRRDAQSVH